MPLIDVTYDQTLDEEGALAGGQDQIAETQQTYDLIASEFARQNVVAAAEVAARIVRTGGSLSMSIAAGDGEGFEMATPYGSDRRRWFTRYREPELTALLTAAGFSIRNVRRHRAYRDWLSIHATREPAGGTG